MQSIHTPVEQGRRHWHLEGGFLMSTTHSATTTAATYVASGSAVMFGLSTNEFAAVAGVCIALLTFALNWYYKRQHLALARARYERLREQEEATEVDDV